MAYRWSIASPLTEQADRWSRELIISPLLAQCLLNRGINQLSVAQQFLQPQLNQLEDPFHIPDMEKAVELMYRYRETKRPLVIFGDYDVDGVTSTTLLLQILNELGWDARYHLPQRLDDGYGLSQEAAQSCLEKTGAKLLLAVDCGSTASEVIDWMRDEGVEVIVLDHHQIASPRPNANALVNPRVDDSAAAHFTELCSAGLAFKLAHALVREGRKRGEEAAEKQDIRGFLDLVALGTIADLAPLKAENRILVSAGLKYLTITKRPGLVALKKVSKVADKVGVFETGFLLSPRLNAAGRLENANEALKLLMADDWAEGESLAHDLDACNRERQDIERNIAEEAVQEVDKHFNPDDDFVIVEGKQFWHVGVIGIVASRVLRQFYRPTFIIGGEGNELRGSGRSIEGFDLAAALRKCDDLLIRHGGHAMAAGISIHPDRIDDFRIRMNELARASLPKEFLRPSVRIDSEISLTDLTLERILELERLEPVGADNPPVQLMTKNVRFASAPRRIGKDNRHLKAMVTDGQTTLEAIWWNADGYEIPSGRFHLAFTPQMNRFHNRTRVQLKWIDWQPA